MYIVCMIMSKKFTYTAVSE